MHRTLVFLAASLAWHAPSAISAASLGSLFYTPEERARLPDQARYGLTAEATTLHWAGRIRHQDEQGAHHHTDWINGHIRRNLSLPTTLKPGESMALPMARPATSATPTTNAGVEDR